MGDEIENMLSSFYFFLFLPFTYITDFNKTLWLKHYKNKSDGSIARSPMTDRAIANTPSYYTLFTYNFTVYHCMPTINYSDVSDTNREENLLRFVRTFSGTKLVLTRGLHAAQSSI